MEPAAAQADGRDVYELETYGWRPTRDELLADPRRKYGPPGYLHRVMRGFTRADLARRFAELGFTRGAEIGVADGRYSEELLRTIPGLQLRCVDPWEPYKGNTRGGPKEQHDGNYQKAVQRFMPYVRSVTMVKAFSMDAVRDVPPASLDFCFIDGNHAFDWVMQDLIEWSRRVRQGGIVAGHDFYHFKGAGVVEAVVAYTNAHGIDDWQICDEREPSFWWVQR